MAGRDGRSRKEGQYVELERLALAQKGSAGDVQAAVGEMG